jgi:hypothetical protein
VKGARVDPTDFEGTLVLEKLAALGLDDDFFDAVDADDFKQAAALMRRAGVDEKTVQIVLAQMAAADGKH